MIKTRSSKWSLQTRILVLSVLISTVVLFVTNWVTTLTSVRAVEGTIDAETTNAARRLGNELEQASATQFPPQFKNQVLEILELEPNLIRVDVYAEIDGTLRLVHSSSTRGDRALEGREIRAFYSGNTDTFTVEEGAPRKIFSVYPVHFSDDRQGFITVVSSLQAVDNIYKVHNRIRLYSLIATTFLLGLAITLVFQTTVYRGVRHLVEVMHRFRQGDTSARASENLAGELGELASNFNHMLEGMERFNENLQSQVEAATNELATRNRELRDLNLQLYETQKQLTQAERLALVGQLTATFAHEVGSPLSAISTHLQMLLEDSVLEPRVRHRLELANNQIDRVCGIVENLLTTTRQASRHAPVDLDEILCKVIHLMGPTLESRRIRLDFRNYGGPFLIEGDPDQLQQLFLNLMNNSLAAIHGAGTLAVEVCRQPATEPYRLGYVQVDVRDSGVGISADRLDQIFEPFFTTKELGKGTGLGLAVSKEIVGQHKGRISVVSEVGKGTCFTVLLPEIAGAAQRQAQVQSAKEVESR